MQSAFIKTSSLASKYSQFILHLFKIDARERCSPVRVSSAAEEGLRIWNIERCSFSHHEKFTGRELLDPRAPKNMRMLTVYMGQM